MAAERRLRSAIAAAALAAACGGGRECPVPFKGELRSGAYQMNPGSATPITEATIQVDRAARTLTMSYRDGGKRYTKRYRIITAGP